MHNAKGIKKGQDQSAVQDELAEGAKGIGKKRRKSQVQGADIVRATGSKRQ